MDNALKEKMRRRIRRGCAVGEATRVRFYEGTFRSGGFYWIRHGYEFVEFTINKIGVIRLGPVQMGKPKFTYWPKPTSSYGR